MKKIIIPLSIFLIAFIIYFGVATQFTFKPKWVLDYFNPLASSMLNFHLDIQNPSTTYDLVHFRGKWYAPWGIIPSLLLIPLQLIKGRFVPLIYLSVFFASLNVVFLYFLLKRLKKEFLPQLSYFAILLLLILFAFGTTHFYVGTLGSTWHVDQMVTSFLATLGIYVIFKKNPKRKDYVFSSIIFSLALLGRATIVILLTLPLLLYLWDNFLTKKLTVLQKINFFKNAFIIFGLPLLFFSTVFFLYNYVRFSSPFEYGYSHIHEASCLAQIRKANGIFSLRNIPSNMHYMLFEIPTITFTDMPHFNFNLKGNSIFFLTPPFLAALLASPIKRRRGKITLDPYITSLWLTAIITIIPSLMHYSTGWIQFGYRYTLDITVLIFILSIFGMKGKLNLLYVLGIILSIFFYSWGISSLM